MRSPVNCACQTSEPTASVVALKNAVHGEIEPPKQVVKNLFHRAFAYLASIDIVRSQHFGQPVRKH